MAKPQTKTKREKVLFTGGRRKPSSPVKPRTTNRPRQTLKPYRDTTGGQGVRVGALRWASLAREYSQQTGVPPEYYLALIQAESGGNNTVVGDNGASVGLFQLHSRGVGAGLTVEQRYDPRLQFELMSPRIASAYQSGVKMGLSGADLAIHVGKLAERPAAGREVKYGYTYAQVLDAMDDGLARNVGDYSPTGLLYGDNRGRPTAKIQSWQSSGGFFSDPYFSGNTQAQASQPPTMGIYPVGPQKPIGAPVSEIADPFKPTPRPNKPLPNTPYANAVRGIQSALGMSPTANSAKVKDIASRVGAGAGGVLLVILGVVWVIRDSGQGKAVTKVVMGGLKAVA